MKFSFIQTNGTNLKENDTSMEIRQKTGNWEHEKQTKVQNANTHHWRIPK